MKFRPGKSQKESQEDQEARRRAVQHLDYLVRHLRLFRSPLTLLMLRWFRALPRDRPFSLRVIWEAQDLEDLKG